MNPLSKAFVILVTLLTIALSCFSIALVGAQEKYKKLAEDRDTQLKTVSAQLQKTKSEASDLASKQAVENSDLKSENSKLQKDLDAANDIAKKAQISLNKTEEMIQRVSANNQILSASIDRVTQESKAYTDKYFGVFTQVSEVNKKYVEANARIAELNDEVRRTAVELNRFKEQYTAAAKQLEEASKEVSVLEERIGKQKLPTEVRVASSQTIQGAVTGTDQASNGVTLVSVNVGEKDQVVPGMEFTISRGSDYVATMVVTTVDAGTAIGRVTNSKLPVASGDFVYIRAYSR